jgi:hypothetical protein
LAGHFSILTFSTVAETIEATLEVLTSSDLTVPVIAGGVTPAAADVAEVAQIFSSGTEIVRTLAMAYDDILINP